MEMSATVQECLQCFNGVGWAAAKASGWCCYGSEIFVGGQFCEKNLGFGFLVKAL